MIELDLLEIARRLEVKDLRLLVNLWNDEHLVNGEDAVNITQEFINIIISSNYRKVEEYKEHACQAETACLQLLTNSNIKKEATKAKLRPHVDKFRKRAFFRWDWLYE